MEIILPVMLICAVIGVFIGQARGRWKLEGAIWGITLGPIGLLIMALAADHSRRCPECEGQVSRTARLCQHCGSALHKS